MRSLNPLVGALAFLVLAACGPATEEMAMTNLLPIRDLWDFSDPAGSEVRFRELSVGAEVAGNDAYAAEAMTQVARTFSLRGEFDRANAILDDVDGGPNGQVPVVHVRSLLERGRTLNSGGQADAALPLFDEAYHLAFREGEHFLMGDAMHMAGIASDLEGEERWVERLVDYSVGRVLPAQQEAWYWLGPMHNNLGWSYFFAGRFEDAYPQFTASRAAYEREDGKRYEVLIADYATGRVLRAMDRCSVALPLQEQAYEALKSEFDTEDEYVAEEIALCRAALGNAEGAIGPAAIAFAKFSQDAWFVENETARLEVLRVLAGN